MARIPCYPDTAAMKHTAVLLLSCPDRKGLVAAIANFLLAHGANILHADQHQDAELGLFLMRVEWDLRGFALPVTDFSAEFAPIAQANQMVWRLAESARKPRIAIFVSRFDHCLADLLYRFRSEELHCEIPVIISNHEHARRLADAYGIPFRHIEISSESRHDAEKLQLAVLSEADVDFIVLARYMQILSTDLCTRLAGRAINIHHSFLPSFKGAKPYHQAHARGVKIIGATAHYVTPDLDEGPIIEQGVERVDHTCTPEDLVAIGRDIETVVLARAVRWHCERRVLLNGAKTVVFK